MKLRSLLPLAVAMGCTEYQLCTRLARAANTPPHYALGPEVLERQWQWVGGTSAGKNLSVAEPTQYTIRFTSEGRIEVRADCNRGVGSYTVGPQQGLSLGPIALTRAMCVRGSQSDQFIQMLTNVRTYALKDGQLRLSLPASTGEMRFDGGP